MKINPDERYLVAVSGGPDSMYLLTQMLEINPRELIVVHVNYHHRLKSDQAQKLVAEFAQAKGLRLIIKDVDPAELPPSKINFEDWARQVRYDFFQTVAQKYGFEKIVVGHQHNDLIETYFLQKKRCNLVNYYGLAPITKWKDLIVVRPLLTIKRSQIIETLNAKKIPYHLDETNMDLKFARNRLRLQLKEADFANYDLEIQQVNQKLVKEIRMAQSYFQKHFQAGKLELSSQLKQISPLVCQRILYQFFWKKDLIKNHEKRKNNPFRELCRRLQTSSKNYWAVFYDDFLIFKDYQWLKILPKATLQTQTLKIMTDQDLEKCCTTFRNGKLLIATIEAQGKHYPYFVSNNFYEYKTKLHYQGKTLNNFYKKAKIPYEIRFLDGVLYQDPTGEVLNKIATI